MSRSWCLVIGLLSSVAVTAFVFDTAATAGPPTYSPKARMPRPPKTCTRDSYQRQECVNGFMGWCQYYRTEDCKTTRTCKVVKPASRC